MRRLLTILAMAAFACSTQASCSAGDGRDTRQATTSRGENNDEENMNEKITIKVNGATFSATLDDNATGRAFAELLPTTLSMEELNGNEKYCYLNTTLPTNASCPGTIEAGDIMLYGSSCVVLFYQTFATSYSYTRIGRVDNPRGLAEALGRGDVSVEITAGDPSGVTAVTTGDKQRDEVYTAAGVKVTSTPKGVYIKNGRKYVGDGRK